MAETLSFGFFFRCDQIIEGGRPARMEAAGKLAGIEQMPSGRAKALFLRDPLDYREIKLAAIVRDNRSIPDEFQQLRHGNARFESIHNILPANAVHFLGAA